MQEKLDIKILRIDSPILFQKAWQIESFLLKTLEYGDYSFRSALTGKLNSRLRCTFFTAWYQDKILATAGCLYSMDNPAVAILGPVCTDSEHRKKGIASRVCNMLLDYLKAQKTQAVYLGVRGNVPASNLYKKLGFTQHSGIIMRKLFVSESEFGRRYLPGQQTSVRGIDWQDFAEVSVFFCEPAAMYSFDFCRHIFSSKYVEPQKFMPVFSDIMSSLEKNSGHGRVLVTKEYSSIVGTAFISGQPSKIQNHIAFLDFFVIDAFLDRGEELISETLKQSGLRGNRMILCYCPGGDIHKKRILLSLGAEQYAVLPGFIRISDKPEETIIYKFTRTL